MEEINNLHSALKFTIEQEVNGSIPLFDIKIMHNKDGLSSTWYNEPTETGLIMNYLALASKLYKHSVVSGFVNHIHRACSIFKSH